MAVSKAQTAAGSKVFVASGTPATYDAAGFDALTWTEVGEITAIPEFGKTFNLVTHNPIGDRKTVKRRGSYNEGSIALDMARVPTDAGQDKLLDALATDTSYNYKITLNDQITPTTGNPTTFYFTAQCMSYTTNIGSVDSIVAARVTLEIDNDIVEKAAV